MKAIQVRYLEATNRRGPRMKATCEGCKSSTISYEYSLSAEKNARMAAVMLLVRQNWLDHAEVDGCGTLPNGKDWVFTLKHKEKRL